MAVMAGREDKRRLDGRVEMDDVYLGGHRPGKRGRGAAGKQPFVAAVSTSDDRRPRKIKLLPVKGFRKKEVKKLVAKHLASTSRLVTDGLRCWTAAAEAGLEHTVIVTGSGKRAAQWSPFKWVDTTLGNVKAAITGTYRHVSPEHAGRYLASFAWRFNRRFPAHQPDPAPRPQRRQDRPAALPPARHQLTMQATQVAQCLECCLRYLPGLGNFSSIAGVMPSVVARWVSAISSTWLSPAKSFAFRTQVLLPIEELLDLLLQDLPPPSPGPRAGCGRSRSD